MWPRCCSSRPWRFRATSGPAQKTFCCKSSALQTSRRARAAKPRLTGLFSRVPWRMVKNSDDVVAGRRRNLRTSESLTSRPTAGPDAGLPAAKSQRRNQYHSFMSLRQRRQAQFLPGRTSRAFVVSPWTGDKKYRGFGRPLFVTTAPGRRQRPDDIMLAGRKSISPPKRRNWSWLAGKEGGIHGGRGFPSPLSQRTRVPRFTPLFGRKPLTFRRTGLFENATFPLPPLRAVLVLRSSARCAPVALRRCQRSHPPAGGERTSTVFSSSPASGQKWARQQ